ncbi:hypothetical protein [Nocardioides montaniterrae]
MNNPLIARFGVIGSAALLLISSFLPWYHASADGLGSANQNGWHNFGPVVFVLALLLIAYQAVRVAGVLPLDDAKADLITVGLAAATLLCGVLFVIMRFAGAGDPPEVFGISASPGWGMYIGIVALIALGVTAFAAFKAGNAMAGLKSLQAQGGNTPPPPPPAPPAAQ